MGRDAVRVPGVPHDGRLDSTLALLRDPYTYISDRCEEFGTDIFEARLLGQRTVCMVGQTAAALFYDTNRFQRSGAAPMAIQKTLFGRCGVQTLDDEEHQRRKALLMTLTSEPGRVEALTTITERYWEAAIERWSRMRRVTLYRELHPMLTQAVCEWAGVPLRGDEVGRRAWELMALFDAAGSRWRHPMARLARLQSNRWIARFIRAIRSGMASVPDDSPAASIAWYRDHRGQLLDPQVAAVELLNLLRPTVAVSLYIVFTAVALNREVDDIDGLDEDDKATRFAQEVRRFYPFFPMLAARVRHDFTWNGYTFRRGTRTLLEVYGTNHDRRVWKRPEAFRPDRFLETPITPFNFIPQGGGDARTGHRCPGEAITMALMKQAIGMLTQRMQYDLPPQKLSVDRSRLPALPRSGFVMTRVRPGG